MIKFKDINYPRRKEKEINQVIHSILEDIIIKEESAQKLYMAVVEILKILGNYYAELYQDEDIEELKDIKVMFSRRYDLYKFKHIEELENYLKEMVIVICSGKENTKKKSKIVEEIVSTNQLIKEKINVTTKIFRPPFGVTNPHIAKALNKTQHNVIGWNIRSLDTVINDEKKLLNRITRQIKPGSIILMHDTSDKTANVLEQLFVFLQKENYKVVPLNELLKIDVYEN